MNNQSLTHQKLVLWIGWYKIILKNWVLWSKLIWGYSWKFGYFEIGKYEIITEKVFHSPPTPSTLLHLLLSRRFCKTPNRECKRSSLVNNLWNIPKLIRGFWLLTQSYLSLYSDTRNKRIFQLADWSVAGMRAVMTDGGQESRASTAPIPHQPTFPMPTTI